MTRNWKDIGALLAAFRNRRGEKRASVEARLRERASSRKDKPAWAKLARRFARAGFLAPIEAGQFGRLTRADIFRIARAYGLADLMLDPLFLQVSPDSFVHASLDRFVRPPHTPRKPGRNADYYLPPARLRSTDTAFVLLDLPARGDHSHFHSHPGDELIYALKGTIELRFLGTGVRTRVPEGGYIHFYAEQRHGAWNVGRGPAQILVIRFYQLAAPSHRQEIADAVRRAKSDPTLLAPDVLTDLAWMARTDAIRHADAGTRVMDYLGFVRLLRRLQCDAGVSYRNVSEAVERAAATIYRIHYPPAGRTPSVARDDLLPLAAALKVPPMLFFDFLFPAAWGAVVVRSPAKDMVAMDEAFVGLPGVQYRVPIRRLAMTDIAVTRLTLEPGKSTAPNRHAGQELLLPLKGIIEVKLSPTTSVRADSAGREFVHFESGRRHVVSNAGDVAATVLVVRFYRTNVDDNRSDDGLGDS